ncbi:MAG: type II toxin-antitoxin system VapC family toxin [Deltaproteobacteria bacterium]|nr:type II toxin-antitoxin system VapC family toxin [Deltaproteobacteria bacterium]
MRILLDTHVWLWLLSQPSRISPAARKLLADPANPLLLSSASSWEISIKYRLGRLPLPEAPARFIPKRLLRDGILPLPVEHHHACRVAELPDHHQDPFDRLLVAQAQCEELILCTADRKLGAYAVELLLA